MNIEIATRKINVRGVLNEEITRTFEKGRRLKDYLTDKN